MLGSALKRPRLSVGLMMLIILAAGVWLADRTNRARRQKELVALIRAAGGTVCFDGPYANGRLLNGLPYGPEWARCWLDPEFFREITAVNLGVGPYDAKDCPQIVKLLRGQPVHTLHVNASFFNEDDFAALRGLTGLRSLSLQECYDLDSVARHLSGLPALEELTLSKARVVDSSITRVGDPTLQAVSRLPNLKRLQLDDARSVTDAGLRSLSGNAGLEVLRLSMSRITDAGLSDVARLRKLVELNLACSAVTDSGLRHLTGLKNLAHLNLAGCLNVTDRGMEEVAGCGALTFVSLLATSVSQRGLESLSRLPKLRLVHLPMTIDADARNNLQALMPNTRLID